MNNNIVHDLSGSQSVVNNAQQDKSASFTFLYWFFKLLKYWYWFVISLVFATGLAFLKNQYWTPTYRTVSTVLIEDGRRAGNDLTSGFYAGSGMRNISNQVLMYKSHDLISKTIDQLGVTNDIYKKTRFKEISCYKKAAILIKENYVAGTAYALEFEIKGLTDSTFQISFKGDDYQPAFSVNGVYGQSLQHQLFFTTIEKTDLYVDPNYQYHFRFLSKSGLIASYSARLACRIKEEGSSVLEISVVGKISERDKDFIDKLNDQFFADNLERKNVAAEKSIDFINKQLMIIKDSLDASELKLNAYQVQSGLYGSGQTARTNMDLQDLDKKRADLKYRQDYFKFLSDYLKGTSQSGSIMTPSMMGIQDAQLTAMVSEYNNLLTKQDEYGDGNPLKAQNQKRLNDVKARLFEMLKTTPTSMKIEENNLNLRYNQALGEVQRMPEKERKLLLHERDFKINDSYYTYLLQRRAESQIQMASNAPDNMLMDKPRTIAVINGADRSNTYTLFMVIGLLMPCIFIVLREFLFKFSVQTRDEVEQIAKLPIIGVVERSDKDQPFVVKNYPKSGFSESFRSIRSKLEYLAKKESSISILVTSTEPGDGKTFIASNLAAVYQLTGKRVIAVDLDLRRPILSKQLNAENKKGVSNYLIGQISLKDAIIPLSECEIDFLPAGTVPPNPSELIRSDKTKEMMSYLKEQYDYIVFDCSPCGLVSDASYIAKYMDVLLYVVRNEVTNKNFFKYTIQELKEIYSGSIGIIYNDVNLKAGQYGSRQYYGKSNYYHKNNSYYHDDLMVDSPSEKKPDNT